MEVIRKRCAQGAKDARGTAVIIDVFRAFSCEPLFFHFGVRKVILEADPEEALALKERNPGWMLVGEVDEVPIEGADLGNSPTEILMKGRQVFQGKVVIHRTTAGVTGAAAAVENADEVLLGSFLTAGAVARYIRGKGPDLVTLVAMGDRASTPAPEDEACADYLESLLTGRPYDHLATLEKVLFQPTAQKFIQGTRPYLPREDPAICLQRDLFDFILKAGRKDGRIAVFKEP